MNSESKKSFWTTLPGILTGLASLITAGTGLWLALSNNDTSSSSSPPHNKVSPAYIECEPKYSVSDPELVTYTLGLLLGGAYDSQPDKRDLAILTIRKELCGPLVARNRNYTPAQVYSMTPSELMAAATKEGLLK